MSSKFSNLRFCMREVETQKDRGRIHTRVEPLLTEPLESKHHLVEPHMTRIDLDDEVRAETDSMCVDVCDMKHGSEHGLRPNDAINCKFSELGESFVVRP